MAFLTTSYTSDDTTGVEDIFCTESGKRFGQQIDQVLEFSRKGLVLTMLPALGNYSQAVLNAMAAGSFGKMLDNAGKKPPSLDIQFVRDAESLMSRVDITKIVEGFEDLPTSEDRGWYFSFTILAIFAYLDVYSRSIIDLMIRNPGELGFDFDEVKGFSVKRRLATVYEKMSIHSILSHFVDAKTLDRLHSGFSKFIKIRGKIAHSNPRLNHDEYSFKELEQDLEEFEIDYSEIDEFIVKIGFAQYGITKVKDATKEIGEVFRKVRLVLMMAATYPALIDAVVCNMIHQ